MVGGSGQFSISWSNESQSQPGVYYVVWCRGQPSIRLCLDNEEVYVIMMRQSNISIFGRYLLKKVSKITKEARSGMSILLFFS